MDIEFEVKILSKLNTFNQVLLSTQLAPSFQRKDDLLYHLSNNVAAKETVWGGGSVLHRERLLPSF